MNNCVNTEPALPTLPILAALSALPGLPSRATCTTSSVAEVPRATMEHPRDMIFNGVMPFVQYVDPTQSSIDWREVGLFEFVINKTPKSYETYLVYKLLVQMIY